MNASMMKSVDKAQADREAALNDMRWKIDQAAREYEHATGMTVVRIEAYRKGHDWKLDISHINAVQALNGKIFT